MAIKLKELSQIIKPKETRPEATPTLRDALTKPQQTVECYYFTPSLKTVYSEIFECVIHKRGQGFWIRAEYGAGKTHFLATLAILLTSIEDGLWDQVHSKEVQKEYRAPLSKIKLFPITFSLLGSGEVEAGDSLMRIFEEQIIEALATQDPVLAKKVKITSEELAIDWYEHDANEDQKAGINNFFRREHKCTPEEFRSSQGNRKFGQELVRSKFTEGKLKGRFKERFGIIYRQIIELGGYDGLLFVVDEFRSWQDRHEGKASFEEGIQVLETLAYYLPVEEKMNIFTIVASQGDCPQKLMGAGQGDRFIVRELLSGKEQSDYGEIVCHRVRDVLTGKDIEIEDYFKYCRENFKFLKQTSKEYFKAIFPFQPRCFDILRRVTQSYERYGLPAARSGIHITYDTLTYGGILDNNRLLVLSDLIKSSTLTTGLKSSQFKGGYESYVAAMEMLEGLQMPGEERELARRIVGTLYLWGIINPEGARGMNLNELAEASLTSLAGVTPEHAVLDLVTRLKSDLPQIKYDKEKGARFESTEEPGRKPEKLFGPLKKKAKANTEAQNGAWREGLFWDFKALGGAGSGEGFEGGFFDGYGQRDVQGNLVLPNATASKTQRTHNVSYGGEVIVADHWSSSFGEIWANKPEVHFRIVYLTQNASVNKSDLNDPRIAVCVPGLLSEDTRENLAELVACDDMLKTYNEKDYPTESYIRDWARTRRQQAISSLLRNQLEEFRRGTIFTKKELGIPAEEIFKAVPKAKGAREDELAGLLLEKAYDAPLFNPKDFRKTFTDADARKVFHGLFSPPATHSHADTSARENFAPGLGLVAKKNTTEFTPQISPAIGWIQERVKQAGDIALSELVKDLCGPPHGLTEDMIRLFVLCAVRAGIPSLVLTDVNPISGFTLTTGKPPSGHKISSRHIPQVEWNNKLEKAFMGSRLKISDEEPFNKVLQYAQVLDKNITAAHTPEEEEIRKRELLNSVKALGDEIPQTLKTLGQIANLLGGKIEEPTQITFGNLSNLASEEDFEELAKRMRQDYPQIEDFRSAVGLFDKAKKFSSQFPDLQSMKSYLDGCAESGDKILSFDRINLLNQLSFTSLWNDFSKLGAIEKLYTQFKEKYSLAYRRAHRQYHEELNTIKNNLKSSEKKITAIDRLNALELGSPIGKNLMQEYTRILSQAEPCLIKEVSIDDSPLCGGCRWNGSPFSSKEEAQSLVKRIEDVSAELLRRVAEGTVRKILEESKEGNVKVLLDIIIASQAERVPDVLTPEVIEKVKGILQDANIEHRDLAVMSLIEDFTAIEEGQIDQFLNKLRDNLKAAFGKAKAETKGKKRIRFFLKS
jgi:hypothetical protein